MKQKWRLESFDDLCGCWLKWESKAGEFTIERQNLDGYTSPFALHWTPESDPDSEGKRFPDFASIEDAKEKAVKIVRKYRKRQVKRALRFFA